MLKCVAFYDCTDFFSHPFFSLVTAKQYGLGNQIYFTGKQLKSSAAD